MSLSFLITFLFSTLLPNPSQSQQQLFSISDSPWRPTQNKTLTSLNGAFSTGFRAISTSRNRYVFSIWYRTPPDQTIAWSANPDSPVDDNASLAINATGYLVLSDSSGVNVWHGPAVNGTPNTMVLNLTDFGDLVFESRSTGSNGSIWRSFDHPTDTVLPTKIMSSSMALISANRKFGFNFSNLYFNPPPQIYNGVDDFTFSYWSVEKAFQMLNTDGAVNLTNGDQFLSADYGESRLRRLTLDGDGNLRIYSLRMKNRNWEVVWEAVPEICTIHGTCGPNAICMSDGTNSDTSCVCPPGFQKAAVEEEGCKIKVNFTGNLQNTKFLRLDYVNFSGGSNPVDLKVQNFPECQSRCLAEPRCLGFGFNYDGNGYCVLQLDRMLYGYWSPGIGGAFFLRVHKSETDQSNFTGLTSLLETTCPVQIKLPLPPIDQEKRKQIPYLATIITLFTVELICGILFFSRFLKKYIKYRAMAQTFGLELLTASGPKRFTYAELRTATNDFSNLIGKGGFGDVYGGELTDHRIVAVKCLKNVTKGDAEFWAEVTIIARMHHLNLVRLWGFCAEKGQRILVYEYVPNGSLDKYLFRNPVQTADSSPGPILDWNIRYRIALGVARAIAYLHEECLEWVLHCDIKPENILLGDDFCPKISDFGLAKLRKKEDLVSMSSKIRGTRGYMAPEWLKMDPITPKADVYSFGMVLLEIVSGVRNFDTQGSVIDSEDWYFPRWAFEKVFKEMNIEDILDSHIKYCYDGRLHFDMVDRMVKTAMWCLQDRPEMRPSMGKVAKMLEGTVEISEPKKPTIFYLEEQ